MKNFSIHWYTDQTAQKQERQKQHYVSPGTQYFLDRLEDGRYIARRITARRFIPVTYISVA